MPDLTNDTIDGWLSPASVTLSAEDIAGYRDAITSAASKVDTQTAFDLVAVAYGLDTPGSLAWFTSAIKEAQPGFVEVKQGALIARLACCTSLAILEAGKGPAALVSLLGQSAEFVGGTAMVPELHTHVVAAQDRLAAARRARLESWTPIAKSIVDLAAKEPAEGETELTATRKAIGRLAQEIDKIALRGDARASLIEEEYEVLWWSFAGRSVTDEVPWSEVAPLARRVVLAADELGSRVQPPGPAIVKSLLATALAGVGEAEVALGDVILAAAEADVSVVRNAERKLLPISSGVTIVTKLGGEGATWSEALAKTNGLKLMVGTKSTALEAALQVFREADIGAHLD
jgi:hypothetical protein